MRSLVVLPGVASPYSEFYRAVYELLEEQAARRGWDLVLLDYAGAGHEPEIDLGLNLRRAVECVTKKFDGIKGRVTLFCRSFGCLVGAELIATKAINARMFENVVFWAPPSYSEIWCRVAHEAHGVDKLNRLARERKKGLVLASDYWNEMKPFEWLVSKFSNMRVTVAVGSADPYCTIEYLDYIVSILRRDNEVRRSIVDGARHQVCTKSEPKVISQYAQIVFGEAIEE